jgi:hypothetical protein
MFNTVTGAAPGGNTTGWDYAFTLRYTTPDGWMIEAGFRGLQTNNNGSGGSLQWSGLVGDVGKTFIF